MDKTKIDWCDMSWNPITGCMHGCEYCYARRVATRFNGGFGERGENHVLHGIHGAGNFGWKKPL